MVAFRSQLYMKSLLELASSVPRPPDERIVSSRTLADLLSLGSTLASLISSSRPRHRKSSCMMRSNRLALNGNHPCHGE